MNKRLIEIDANVSQHEQEQDDTTPRDRDMIFKKWAVEAQLHALDRKLARSFRIAQVFLFVVCCVLVVILATTLGLVIQQNAEIKDLENTISEFKLEIGSRFNVLEGIEEPPESCTNSTPNGYQILHNRTKAVCDNGWTIFQRRFDGSVSFNRPWQEYKIGFGNLSGEFWWGLEKISRITSNHICRLRIDLGGFDETSAYAEYSSFSIAGEEDNYRLYVFGFSGDAGDSLFNASHNGMPFTTKDRDNDKSGENCAALKNGKYGAWWHDSCYESSLNAPWGRSTGKFSKMIWYTWKGWYESVKESAMKLRCD